MKPTKTETYLPTASSHGSLQRFVLMLLGGMVVMIAVGLLLKVRETDGLPATAAVADPNISVTNDEAIYKWLRDRVDGAFGIEFTGRRKDEVDVTYRTRDARGNFVDNQRTFCFDGTGRLASVVATSFTPTRTETATRSTANASRPSAGVMPPTSAPVQTVSATSSDFPWGVRAQKARAAQAQQQAAAAAQVTVVPGVVDNLRPADSLQPAVETVAPAPAIPDDFPWGVRAEKAKAAQAAKASQAAYAVPVVVTRSE